MKTKILLIAFILFAFFVNTQAQNNKKEKKYKSEAKSKIILKIDKQGIPNNLNPGESFVLDINIENNSKTTYWNSNSLTFDVEYPFIVNPNYQLMITLSPGESATFNFTVIAPNTNGKEKFKMIFYNDGKKKKQVVKTINIGYINNYDYNKENKKNDNKD
ncbi:MAG TPA: hypothetical protein VIK14_04225 [Ignavibacteria bacterium]